MSQLDKEIVHFLKSDKVAMRAFRWTQKSHPDYQQARAAVSVITDEGLRGWLILNSHISRNPRKYTFALVFRNTAILRLDVCPGRPHTNFGSLGTVRGTHWQKWPLMQLAIPDNRVLNHKLWFQDFCRESKIVYPFAYVPPTHVVPDLEPPPEQGRLELQ